MALEDQEDGADLVELRGSTRRVSQRLAVAVVAALSLLGGVAYLADQAARAREGAAVGRCAAAVSSVVSSTGGRVSAMAGYMRPVLAADIDFELRAGLLGVVSDAAGGHEGWLADVRADCAAVEIWPVHGDLRARRSACLEHLDVHARFLEAVSVDGRAAYGSGEPRPDC